MGLSMSNERIGSTWKKWDLHVHTPASIVNNYPGKLEEAWEAFFSDLEALPPDFKVIGINDYLFVDGYERVLKAKREGGRLKNLDLILPVVELRLDKFGGVVKEGKGGFTQSGWSRINLHVIFDQVEPALIREQFLSAISPDYKLIAGAEAAGGTWGGVITPENLTALGQAIIDSVPADKRDAFGSPLKEGFNNLNVGFERVKLALSKPLLADRHLLAIGKTEWENLKWDDHTIAEKKSVINEADLVFTAAENPEAYLKGRNKLRESGVNAALLDCSDAHHLRNTEHKDRIGNCFTWIKADATFSGLAQAIYEFDDRVYVGDVPPKRQLVERNRTKYASAIRIGKKPGSTLTDTWFDVDLPLNADLVAIIGNKGSGKSALSDIIALVGDTKNHGGFSFLNDNRFRNPKGRLAQHFVGTLVWQDGNQSKRDLDEDPQASSVERVKYLPQSYLETLCNELGGGGSSTFDTELRKIIYSHVPEEDQLGKASMDELLDFKVAEINAARQSVLNEISKINAEILLTQKRLTQEFKVGLEEQLATKKAELVALEGAKPAEIEDPGASATAQVESQQAAALIQTLEQQAQEISKEEATLRERKSLAAKKQAVSKRIVQALSNHRKTHELFVAELQALLNELDSGVKVEDLVELRIESAPIDNIATAVGNEILDIDAQLQSAEPGSLMKRREGVETAIAATKGKLDEKQRLFIRYKEALAEWEGAKVDLVGSKDKVNSIAWFEAELEGLNALPNRLAGLRANRIELTKKIHEHIVATGDEYKRLYEPVQAFVKSAEKMDMSLPLDFEVRIEESRFQEHFLGRLNRQSRGSFSGVDDSNELMRVLLREASFVTADDAVVFAEKIDDMLRYDRRDQQGRETRLADQLRRGVEAQELLDYLYGLAYLSPRYSLTYDNQEIGQLSPGERGLLLLVFYLLVDKDDIPIVIDQPEENLDNQTIYRILVKCIKAAKERRQVIMVTHNPNLAVVCDAEQIIYAQCNKAESRFTYDSGGIENPTIRAKVVQILEGTEPAFKNRRVKYGL
ncbi:putative AbiEii toxin of type IV toxin-antitoxin system [Paraburkholderia sp. BL23I1N1]|nr:putative AbiEii toxin of type IV toxin-antitoxin system [Paraburkholderia sp. BL27I4N3]RKE35658.1 putative AbiEii toxin of type IV toxin-antitoxin system [Paraburkholderia sp. BL23I1N1]